MTATQAALEALDYVRRWKRECKEVYDYARANSNYGAAETIQNNLRVYDTIRQALVNAERVPELIAALKAALPVVLYTDDNETGITKNRYLLEVADKMQKALAAFNAGRDEGEK